MSLGHEELVNGRHAAQSKSTDVVQISEKIGLFDNPFSMSVLVAYLIGLNNQTSGQKPTPSVLVAYLV